MAIVTNIFIQARMSSSRFPGKVLSILHGRPLIKHIVDSARKVKGVDKVVVLTSLEKSDDLLVAYLEKIACDYFRGSLENVFCRFQSSLKAFPCDYFVRFSADSPLLDACLVESMVKKFINKNYDIISNVIVRTFPKGQSVEIIKANVFLKVDKSVLTQDDSEHVFPYFYRHKSQYKIRSIRNESDQSYLNLCVDTKEDLERLAFYNDVYQVNQMTSQEARSARRGTLDRCASTGEAGDASCRQVIGEAGVAAEQQPAETGRIEAKTLVASDARVSGSGTAETHRASSDSLIFMVIWDHVYVELEMKVFLLSRSLYPQSK